jgi:NitT/TauT family transport system substrate-binding protein
MPRRVHLKRRAALSRIPLLALALALFAALSGCGLLGGSEDEPSSNDTAVSAGGLERTKIKISVMPTIDLAPFHLALKNNYFKQEGLDVEWSNAQSGGASVARLTSGEVDIAYSSWTPFFVAKSKGAADIKLVADASSAGPGSTMVVAMPTSSVKSVRDMQDKRVAVTAQNTISDLMIKSVLKTNGIDHTTIKWAEIPFPQTAERLKKGDVDAAFVTEPFLTGAQKSVGAVPVFDTAQGPTANMPTAGFGSTAKFVKENPKTLAAFQRVMQKATDEAKDRGKIEPLIQDFAKVDADTAKLATLLTFSSTLDASRIQRVPDLMLEFGVIPEKIDVNDMIVKSEPVS